MEKTTRRRWTQEESEGFLRCYLARKAEFEHPKKKRQAYANTLEDMICLGITDSGRTPLCLEGRMRTLLQAYKAARDNNNRTGSSPCFDPYMELMEEIFGRVTPNTVTTLGTVFTNLVISGCFIAHTLHIVNDDFNIPSDDILGKEFLKLNKCVINCQTNIFSLCVGDTKLKSPILHETSRDTCVFGVL
ncbi:uncharacterized protein LOC118736065 [Rhagoletis pomonella]|uniref:uncharacterized protein LOC118736065 n=1 Tax=Rhagoletis pomonella TaxID=28610 RepID=UPI001785D110|nr:uncharacterized protein LOC118736065 [Rhagoletis pomonella]